MGSLIRYELSQQLFRKYGFCPEHLMISSYPPPHLAPHRQVFHKLFDHEFLSAMKHCQGEFATPLFKHIELQQLMLPALRADFQLLGTYYFSSCSPLPYPISCFGAGDDVSVTKKEFQRWSNLTQSSYDLTLMTDNHFFLHHESQTHFLSHLASMLRQIIVRFVVRFKLIFRLLVPSP